MLCMCVVGDSSKLHSPVYKTALNEAERFMLSEQRVAGGLFFLFVRESVLWDSFLVLTMKVVFVS